MTDDANARSPLSLHAVSFGLDSTSSSLRRMTQIALEVQKIAQLAQEAQNDNALPEPLHPAATAVPSSYTEALDTVR